MNRRHAAWLLMGGGLGASALGGCAAFRSAQIADDAETKAPPIGRFLNAPQRVHYIEAGAGRPIVLLHGASGNLRDWTFGMMDAVAQRGRAIAADRPGYGYSEQPSDEQGWLPKAQAAALRRFVRQLTDEPLILVGHSWSGALALRWALDYPEDVAGILSLAGATTPWPGGVGFIYDLVAAPLVGPAFAHTAAPALGAQRLDEAVRRIFAPNDPPPGYVDRVGASLALRPASIRFNAKSLSDLKPAMREQYARYPEITIPIEAVHGPEDEVLPFELHARGLDSAAPTANLTSMSGIGHMPHHAAPDQTMAALDRLIARVDAG